MSRHHRKPKSRGGSWDESNISIITKEKHRAWHLIFGIMTPHNICHVVKQITDTYLDPAYEIIVRKKEV